MNSILNLRGKSIIGVVIWASRGYLGIMGTRNVGNLPEDIFN